MISLFQLGRWFCVIFPHWKISFNVFIRELSQLFMPLPGTLSSCTIADLFVTSSISVLIMIEVFLPFASRLASNFSKMKVHWLQLSSSPYVFTILPVFLYCNLTGTTHILMTFVTVFTNAHLTPPSIISSLFWFF